MLTYGPLNADGTLKVGLFFDHRVYDGATAARALARLEAVLLGPILDELTRELAGATSPQAMAKPGLTE